MTTAIMPTMPAATPTTAPECINPEHIGLGGWPAMKDWTQAHRRLAATWGWQHRKDERLQIVLRVNRLLKTGNPRVLRLFACDLAETTLPLWEACYPGDVRLLALLQVARRYAVCAANDAERLAASRLAVMVCRDCDATHTDRRHDPAYAAANAVGFCLWRLTGESLRQAAWWTEEAYRHDHYTPEGAQRFLAEVEARLNADVY